jgi:uncharacterized coiled-coil protein SlyX
MFLKSFFRLESEIAEKERTIKSLQNELAQTNESSTNSGEQLSGSYLMIQY